jgi:DHA1 family bicyclomycin/chloramphenicol resistance-like MFS transporter
MYLPAFPAIASNLKTDIATVALSLTSYFIGISFGQLGYGPLLDRYGRKKPLVVGLILYIVAGVGCALSLSIESLIVFRLLLALGACVGIVSSRAVVRDLFSGSEIARVLSILVAVFGIAPIIAPTVGGLVVAWLGWRFIFIILSVIVMLMLFAVKEFLKESKGHDPSISLKPTSITVEYLKVLKNREFFIYTITGAASAAGFFSYISDSAFVYMSLLGFSATGFGWMYGANACGLIGASQVNRLLLKKLTSTEVLFIATVVQLGFGLVLFSGSLIDFLPTSGIIGLIFCYLFCFGFVVPNATALALQPFTRNAGSASALNGSIHMLSGALASILVSYLHNGTILPMVSMMTGFTAIGVMVLGAHLLSVRRRLRSAPGSFD